MEISKNDQDYFSCIDYIEGIQDNAESLIINKELLRDWIGYKFKLNQNKDVINKIES